MKFTFICEDGEEGTRVEHTTPEIDSWVVSMYYYQMFLLGCGFAIKKGYKLGPVEGDAIDNLSGGVEYE